MMAPVTSDDRPPARRDRPVRIAVMGLGSRGASVYADFVERHPDDVRLVAVAEPDPLRRNAVGATHHLSRQACFSDYVDLADAAAGLGLDAVVIALPDAQHVDALRRAVALGIPVLVEKPLATTPEDLTRLEQVAATATAPIVVAHVLRYTPFFRAIKSLLDSGALGAPCTIRLEENIGYWHFAHSFVRGNWRRSDTSSPMILAKSCHDLDLLRWLADAEPRTVSSTGSLAHFRAENAPDGAPLHCVDGCPVADSCAFFAPRYYVEAMAQTSGPPVSLLGPDLSPEGRLRALATSDYGRCVYRCDNDVADHQQVLLSFTNSVTATLSVSAFTSANTRTVQITGTGGEIVGNMESGELTVHLFSPTRPFPELPPGAVLLSSARVGPLGHRAQTFTVRPPDDVPGDHRGHAGGDEELLTQFVSGLHGRLARTQGGAGAAEDVGAQQGTTFAASVDSHRMAFAAEASRLSGRTIELLAPTCAERLGGQPATARVPT